jgi:AraC family transcriptional regulator
MKPSASGRILIWRGGSLWIGLAGEPAGMHAHHAVQITLPFDGGAARFQVPGGRWKGYSSAIVIAQQPHAFEARGQLMAQIFVEPESRDGRALQTRHRAQGIAALEDSLSIEVEALAAGYESCASNADLIALAQSTVRKLAGASPTSASAPDARIAQALELIRTQLGGPVSLKTIAQAVHLSPDRFRHLFMEQTGVGFRPYVLWQRLDTALVAYVGGNTLTEAAYNGGFSDSAHFSRTFRKMFGIAPASVRPE